MINDQNKIEIIDLYLENALPEKQKLEVEERMKNDYYFRNEVELQRKVIAMIKEEEREGMKKELDILFESKEDEVRGRVVSMRPSTVRYAIAATVSVLLLAGGIFYLTRDSAPEVQYVAVNLVDGARGTLPDGIPEQLPLIIYPEHDEYHQHYQLGDTLRLYGNFDLEKLSLEYEPNQASFILRIQEKVYLLNPNDQINSLQQ
jgi:hypothetical protein